MIKIENKALCCGCHSCAQACPRGCITMAADEEGFLYPKVDESRCIDCGLCQRVCPVLTAEADAVDKLPLAFAAMNKEEAVREESSSGGVFSLLADQVLAQGGVVFGAAWDVDFQNVRHIGVETPAELGKLRGSKYLQSAVDGCYSQAEAALKQGRKVLFTGTPCQIEGLHRFLRAPYENLLCVDLVCHGVPSPAVWRVYLEECQKAQGAPASRVCFRDKTTGWKEYCVTLEFRNGKKQSLPVTREPYMAAFLRNACLRPSCTQCPFKKKNRVSDLTLADFWGIREVCPQMDDDRGTSLVLVHSPAGKAAWEAICGALRWEAVDAEAALRENPSAVRASADHENRRVFLESLGHMPFGKAVKKWLPRKISPKERAYHLLQRTGLLRVAKVLLGRK